MTAIGRVGPVVLTPNGELRARWPVLAGTVIAMFAGATSLPYATAGMFIPALAAAFGWHRSAISFGPALYMAGVALTTPVVGLLVERYEARRLVFAGMLAIALGFAGLSRMGGDLRLFYALYVGVAILGNLSGTAVLTAIVMRSFDRARGRALGISMAGAGLTTSIGGPLVFLLIQAVGWRRSYLTIGLFVLATAPLVWRLLRGDPGPTRRDPSGVADGVEFRRGIALPLYWWLMAAFFFISIASMGLIVHFLPLLIDRGAAPAMAATLAGGIGVGTISGRLLSGFLIDRFDARFVSAIVMLLGVTGFSLFLFGGMSFAICGSYAVGLTYGSETSLAGFMVAHYFGMRSYGRLFGALYGVVLLGAVLSPLLYGASRDMLGSYEPMLGTAIGLLLAAAAILGLLPSKRSLSRA